MNAEKFALELDDLARRVRNNVPRHGKPDAFHEEKSEIARDLEVMAGHLRDGRISKR